MELSNTWVTAVFETSAIRKSLADGEIVSFKTYHLEALKYRLLDYQLENLTNLFQKLEQRHEEASLHHNQCLVNDIAMAAFFNKLAF